MNMDIELSEKIASEAGKQIHELKEILNSNKNVYISLLQDSIVDLKSSVKFIRKLCVILCAIILVLILSICAISIYNQNKIFKLINETEFESTIEMNNDNSTNFGNITAK